jgi:anthranilate synthase component 1
MADTDDLVTLSLSETDLDPATVYAKLRSYTPGRPSFLLESRQHGSSAGRYSIAGYRVRSGEMMPPGVDAIAAQLESYGRLEAPASFAEAVARSAVGYFGYGSSHAIHQIRHWEDEGVSGYFLTGATVVVFDHHERTVTVAGRKAGRVAERCAWELRHGPEPAPLASSTGASPAEELRPTLAEEQLGARLARAKRFLGDPVHELALAQGFRCSMAGADPFDVYRALRASSSAPGLYFVDFGASPMTAPLHLLGVTGEPQVARRASNDGAVGVAALGSELRACFPHRAVAGTTPLDAARVIRRLEDTSREFLGSMVGYLGPGAQACFALAERVIAARADSFELACAVPLRADTDPVAAAREAPEAVRLELAAIRVAQEMAASRPRATTESA